MEEIIGYLQSGKIIIFISLICILLTFLFSKFFKGNRYIKYLPGSLFIGVGIFNFISGLISLADPESLNNFSLFVVLTVAGLVGLLSGVIIGVYNKPVKRKKKRKAAD